MICDIFSVKTGPINVSTGPLAALAKPEFSVFGNICHEATISATADPRR
jgi:hypothetical protein